MGAWEKKTGEEGRGKFGGTNKVEIQPSGSSLTSATSLQLIFGFSRTCRSFNPTVFLFVPVFDLFFFSFQKYKLAA